jgi:hypothetical protein
MLARLAIKLVMIRKSLVSQEKERKKGRKKERRGLNFIEDHFKTNGFKWKYLSPVFQIASSESNDLFKFVFFIG